MYSLQMVLNNSKLPSNCKTTICGVTHHSDNFAAVSVNEQTAIVKCLISCDVVTLGIAYIALKKAFDERVQDLPVAQRIELLALMQEIGDKEI